MLTVILVVVFVASLSGAVVLILRKFPELVLLDVESIARERAKKVKYELIRRRVERAGLEMAGSVRRGLRPLGRVLLREFRKLYARVLELEHRYRSQGKGVDRSEKVEALMAEARDLVKAGEFPEAERRYAAAIALDPKYAKAYEEIARLAVRDKRWNEAEQAIQYVLRQNSDDASAHANYGELEIARGNARAALLHFEDAVRRKPASPKYLSFLLDAAIEAGARDTARETFSRLKEVNPENQKLPQWEQKVREMP